jgi:hypothetical protein
MAGRHAAPPDEAFDQRERDGAGTHRADGEPLGPDEAAVAKPATKKPARAKAAPKRPSSTSKKAGTP